MYYNKLIKYMVISMSCIVILISIFSNIGIIKNFELENFCIIALSIELLLVAYNSYKMKRSKWEVLITSMAGIFIIVSTIIRINKM